MAEDKRIVVNGYVADLFYNSTFFVNNPNISVTQLCNTLVEKFINGELIELTPENLRSVNECASQIDRDNAFVVNSVMEKIDLTPIVKPEKLKVEVSSAKQKLKVLKKNTANQVSNW